MIRNLLAGTALISILATGAVAQAADSTNNVNAAAQTDNGSVAVAPSGVFYSAAANDQAASKLIGTAVYESSAQDAKKIGDINDLLLGQDGRVEAVVVGVGGFLGIGEKNVAITYAQFQWTVDADGNARLVAGMTRDQLNSAPAFDYAMLAPNANGNVTVGATANNQQSAQNAGNAGDNNTGTGDMTAATGPKPGLKDQTIKQSDSANAKEPSVATPDQTEMRADQGAVGQNSTDMAANNNTAATANQSDQNTTAAISNQPNLHAVAGDQVSADKLKGTTVYGADNKDIGSIGDVVLTTDGKIDAIVVDVGGFLGIGQKPVAISMNNLQFMQDNNGKWFLYTDFTQDQLKNQPAYDATTYSQNRDQQLLIYKR